MRKLKYGFKPKEDFKEYCRLRQIAAMKREPLLRLFSVAKYRAKQKGIKFTIKREEIEVPTHCPILGIKLKYNEGKRGDSTYSLDRVDNSKGYVKGNVAVISWRANRLKNNLSPKEIKAVYQYLQHHKKIK